MVRQRKGPSSEFFERFESTQPLSHVPIIGKVYDLGRRVVSGCSSPNFFAADWAKASTIVKPGSAAWQENDRNPDRVLRHIPSTWRRVTIYEVGQKAVDSLKTNIASTHPDVELQPSVSFLAGDTAHVAPLPEGFGNLVRQNDEYEIRNAAGLREGSGPIVGSLTLWSEELRRLWLIEGVKILEQHVRIEVMAEQFPGIPVA